MSICPMCQLGESFTFREFVDFEVLRCESCGFQFIDTKSSTYPENAQYQHDDGLIANVDWTQPHILRRRDDIIEFVPPPARCLDIGCGGGEVSLALSNAGFQCTGLDMKKTKIDFLQDRCPNVDWVCHYGEKYPDFESKFDVVTLYHVLEHISDPRNALRSVRQLVKPGGMIVIEVPNVSGMRAKLLGKRWQYYKVDHVNYFREKDLVRLMDSLGLEVLDVKSYQHFSYPQGVKWKDVAKGVLSSLGFNDVISAFIRC